jgi:hypothetical protein
MPLHVATIGLLGARGTGKDALANATPFHTLTSRSDLLDLAVFELAAISLFAKWLFLAMSDEARHQKDQSNLRLTA